MRHGAAGIQGCQRLGAAAQTRARHVHARKSMHVPFTSGGSLTADRKQCSAASRHPNCRLSRRTSNLCTQCNGETPDPSTSGSTRASASRQSVFRACSLTAAVLAAGAIGIRLIAPISNASLFGNNSAQVQSLLQSEPELECSEARPSIAFAFNIH